jgi:hypothetical protein
VCSCLQLAGDSIDFINYQLYAELESPDTTAQQVRSSAASLGALQQHADPICIQ